MFEEQVGWAVDAGVDFVIGETFSLGRGGADRARRDQARPGMPAVITLAMHQQPVTREGWSPAEACARLEDAGADVVGLNCIRGPRTMLPLLARDPRRGRRPRRGAAGAVPHARRASRRSSRCATRPIPTLPGGRPFPTALDPFTCNRYEIADFARDGRRARRPLPRRLLRRRRRTTSAAWPRRSAARRRRAATRADMSKHAFLGTDPTLRAENREYASEL